MSEEQVEVEHISLHWIHQEHTFRHRSARRPPAESRQEYLTSGKEYIEPWKTRQDEGAGGETGVLIGLDLPLAGGGTEAGVQSPTLGQLSESEEKHLRLRVKQPVCGSLNGMRIRQSLSQPYIPRTGTQVPWTAQRLGAGVQGLWRNPRVRAAVDCREMNLGDVREETVVGSACGAKPGSHGSKALLLSHTQRVEPSPQPFSPHRPAKTAE